MDLDLLLREAPVSRRRLLGVLGMAGLAAVLGACGSSTSRPTSTAGSGPTPGTPSARPSGTPATRPTRGGSLAMCGWPDDVNPDSVDLFKRRFGISALRYDARATDEGMVAALAATHSGLDIAAPAARLVPRLVEAGLIQELDRSRIPNARHISAAFRGPWWDPADRYQVPKDYGSTGILYRRGLVDGPLTSWREFRALVTSDALSGRTVFVDSMDDVLAFPLKLLGASVGSGAKADLDGARTILLEVAPHLQALDSTTYGERLRRREAVLALGWSAPLETLRLDPDASDVAYVVPSEGTLLWLDTWVLVAGAPNPDAGYAWLDFIHEPAIQAGETSYTGHATPNDAAKELVDPALLADPAVFPPENVLARSEVAGDTSASAQRSDIWEEFRARVGRG